MDNIIQQATNTAVGIIAWSGVRYDLGSSVGFMNDWQSIDNETRAQRRYNHRFDINGTIHGKWFCYAK